MTQTAIKSAMFTLWYNRVMGYGKAMKRAEILLDTTWIILDIT